MYKNDHNAPSSECLRRCPSSLSHLVWGWWIFLKGVVSNVKDHSQLVYPNICLQEQICEHLGDWAPEVVQQQNYQKTPLLHYFVCSQMPELSNILVRNYLFLKNYVISEGAVFHNVLYYQQIVPY